MAEAWVAQGRGGGRLDRLLDRIPLAPVWVGIGFFAAIAAFYLTTAATFGRLDLVFDAGQPLGLGSHARFDLVTAALIAYTAIAQLVGRRAAVRDLIDLRPILRLSDPEHSALVKAAWRSDRRRLALASGLGAAVGVAVEFVALSLTPPELRQSLRGPLPYSWGVLPVWGVLMNALLFALLAQVAYLSLARARGLSTLGRHRTEVRLLDSESRGPFARAGLRQAVFWFVGSSIASLLVLEAVAPGVVGFVLAVTVSIGIVALVLPARGIRQAVRRAKRRELAWVRGEIEAGRALLTRPPTDGLDASARLPALLAYEARLLSVRDWPFDLPTLARFSLFLLLPLGSWVGGALVERLLDVVLD